MVDYRTIITTFTITPTSTVSVDNLILDNSTSVAAIAAIVSSTIKLLSKNSDGSLTLQITQVQEFTAI